LQNTAMIRNVFHNIEIMCRRDHRLRPASP
jgi:hypothetical protein